MTDVFKISSYAKINLFLDIVGRRPDGYHDLLSLMVKIDLCDALEFRSLKQPRFEIECQGHPELQNDDNLILRVARRLAPKGCGVQVRLHKQVPIGGGLGGGSANAAAAIIAMEKLFDLELAADEKFSLAASLGADVPFFLSPEPAAMVSGTGTQIRPISRLPKLPLILINPGFGVPTAWAYQAYALDQSGRQTQPSAGQDVSQILTLSHRNDKNFCHNREKAQPLDRMSILTRRMRNSLEAVVTRRYPEIGEMTAALEKAGALKAMMSGSGATVFGLFRNREAAASGFKQLTTMNIGSNRRPWIKQLETLA